MDFNELKKAVSGLNEERMITLLCQVMEDGGSLAMEALEACLDGVEVIRDLFNEGEYLGGDLIYADEMIAQASMILKPALKEKVMRKNFGAKSYLYPQPVLIIGSYDADGAPDAMNAAWGGITDTNEITMCLSASHKTVKNILVKKAFTVSIGTVSQMVACDFVGLVSGNNVPDKMEKAGFHTVKAEFVDAPVIIELPLALECRLVSYDAGTGRMIGEIVNVCAEESILGDDGEIDAVKLEAITYDPVHHKYIQLGDIVGNAFKDGGALKSSN